MEQGQQNEQNKTTARKYANYLIAEINKPNIEHAQFTTRVKLKKC